jgi:hypothetical protein
MDASADYAAVGRALSNQNFPPYVSYLVRTHAGFDAIAGDDSSTIVVRTSDGTIVSGKKPKINVGGMPGLSADAIRHGPFDAACYRAESAQLTTFESMPAEAIALRPLCATRDGSDHEDDDTMFSRLYADPRTHRPIAVIGEKNERYVKAHVDERFVLTDGFVVPSSFNVKVVGSGPMFWLNVDARQAYSEFRFLSHWP